MAATTTSHIAIELPHGVHVLFTTRRGGVSEPPFDSLNLGRWTDDDPAAIEENRRRALALTGASRFAYGRQVHGAAVLVDSTEVAEADGQVTTQRGVAVMALTADCMPIALAGPDTAGMVHAGWRGLAGGVIEEGVRAAREVVAAAIGPCARGCCYEVGDEVRDALGLEPAGGPARIDLPALARERLAAAGIEHVEDTGMCTMCSDRSLFYSHRRDRGRTGRQAGIAWR
ncbi:MAG TPA: polyphenol oxidase family protein [Solirubrobacteraceae bacterium]|jgi:hypothetical protein